MAKPFITPEEQAQNERVRKLSAAFAGTALNRDAVRLLALLRRVEALLDRIGGSGPAEVLAAWKAAGLWKPADDPWDDPDAASVLDSAQALADQAGGFAWALGHFTSVLELEACEGPRQNRRRRATEARVAEAGGRPVETVTPGGSESGGEFSPPD